MNNHIKHIITGKTSLVMLLIVGICMSISIYLVMTDGSFSIGSYSGTPNYSSCSNLTILKAANCIYSFVIRNYSYKETDDKVTASRTIDELIQGPGDCYDYARLYDLISKDLGYNSKIITFNYAEGHTHAYTIISSIDGWCILDLDGEPDCRVFILSAAERRDYENGRSDNR